MVQLLKTIQLHERKARVMKMVDNSLIPRVIVYSNCPHIYFCSNLPSKIQGSSSFMKNTSIQFLYFVLSLDFLLSALCIVMFNTFSRVYVTRGKKEFLELSVPFLCSDPFDKVSVVGEQKILIKFGELSVEFEYNQFQVMYYEHFLIPP